MWDLNQIADRKYQRMTHLLITMYFSKIKGKKAGPIVIHKNNAFILWVIRNGYSYYLYQCEGQSF